MAASTLHGMTIGDAPVTRAPVRFANRYKTPMITAVFVEMLYQANLGWQVRDIVMYDDVPGDVQCIVLRVDTDSSRRDVVPVGYISDVSFHQVTLTDGVCGVLGVQSQMRSIMVCGGYCPSLSLEHTPMLDRIYLDDCGLVANQIRFRERCLLLSDVFVYPEPEEGAPKAHASPAARGSCSQTPWRKQRRLFTKKFGLVR